MKCKSEEKKKESPLIKYVKDRIFKKNKNFFMIVVGPTGSGKSYSALKFGELLDPSFNINRCSFRAREFMGVINELVDSEEEHKGKVIMWDELGVEHSAREFMTISNRIINYFFQTSRNLNLIIIMTVPLLSFIDSNTRKLCHCIAETTGINSRTEKVSLKIKLLQVNVTSGKEYPKYLRYMKENKHHFLKKVKVGLPSEKIRNSYEEKKLNFNKGLNKRITFMLDKIDGKDKEKSILDKGTTKQREVRREYVKQKGDIKKVAEKIGIKERSVYKRIGGTENKEKLDDMIENP